MVNKTLIIIALLAMLFAGGKLSAELVVNEIMTYYSGDDVGLEWIEIHNNSDQNPFLGLYSLGIDGWNFVMPDAGVQANSYFIICQNLTTFEQVWGDASGTWGDDSDESYSVFQITGIDLNVDTGVVEVLFGGTPQSSLSWGSSGTEGISRERIHPDSSGLGECVEQSGATPGRINSITPVDNDLAITSMTVERLETGESYFEIIISNVGFNAQSGGQLGLYYDNDRDQTVTQADFAAFFDYVATQPEDNIIINIAIDLNGVYPYMLALLPSDDKLSNNKLGALAYGTEYPPIIITEFLADPGDGLSSEWVEIYNKTSSDINMKNWFLGDAVGYSQITAEDYFFPSNEYLILCQDCDQLLAYYAGQNIVNYIEPLAWKRFNDTGGDIVRIRDDVGVTIDSTNYEYTYGGNYSWALDDEGQWGRSKDINGTPGLENEVLLEPNSSEIKATITPNPFSPTSENAVIEIENLPGDEMKLIVYDIKGRAVWSEWTDIPPFDGQITWDGRDDDGEIVPIGIYIVYLEVLGVGSYKTTVVVAP